MGQIWNRLGLAHTTMLGTHRIERLPDADRDEFQQTVIDALGTVPIPDLNRVTNVIGQELLQEDVGKGKDGAYLWSIRFNGVHAPEAVRKHCETMYEGVRAPIERVARRSSFSIATLSGLWDTKNE